MSREIESEREKEQRRYYMLSNRRSNSKIYPFAIWDQPTPSQRSVIVGFAASQESADSILRQLREHGFVEDMT